MRLPVAKRSIVIAGHKTSISLEDEFWNGLKTIAQNRRRTLSGLVAEIDKNRQGNLSSAIRVFVFGHLCAQPQVLSTNGSGYAAGVTSPTFAASEQQSR
ncbi:MAG TPA: ribbon-helix-helix domain-containing protein [Xanthobacteraceae bacterium]|jgi:predicted DNA-binding ribbon-helix-helix protein